MYSWKYFVKCYSSKVLCEKFNIFEYSVYKKFTVLSNIRLKFAIPVKKFSDKNLKGIVVRYFGYLEFLCGQHPMVTTDVSFSKKGGMQKYLTFFVTLRNNRLWRFLMMNCYLKFLFLSSNRIRLYANQLYFYGRLKTFFVKKYQRIVSDSFIFLTACFLNKHFTNVYLLNLLGFYHKEKFPNFSIKV